MLNVKLPRLRGVLGQCAGSNQQKGEISDAHTWSDYIDLRRTINQDLHHVRPLATK